MKWGWDVGSLDGGSGWIGEGVRWCRLRGATTVVGDGECDGSGVA